MRSPLAFPSGWDKYVGEIGANIHRLRIARGYSQDRVAYEANLSRYTYQQLERGRSSPQRTSNPRLMTLLAIAQVLEVPLDDLLPDAMPDLTAR
ncbi:helix-turn-helix transcriptional regulator [Microbacterium sp. NPDC077184]|uniref:helix-turn-helix domain-containing protein n=1 Tax=Microbacterium sp. NPDC077184 TaxID=3154764 RepID=UPI00342A381C